MRFERSKPDGRGWELVILHADGSETQVTTDQDFPNATISPDGSRIVVASGTAMYAVDANGGPREVLLESQDLVYDPTFSPDGTQIAYATGGGDHSHRIWVMDADGTHAHEIVFNRWTAPAGHVRGLAWSPAGDRIALGLEPGIFTFAPDGSDFTRVIANGTSPYWSRDGSQIAYTILWPFTDRAHGVLAIADADGANVRKFDFATSGPWHPAPSEPSE